jgi:hypothetical protein
MFDNLDEADQLSLICGEFSMSWHDGLAEERDRTVALVEHGPESCLEHITFDHELPVERRKPQNWCRGHGVLERSKSIFGLLTPPEALLA